MKIIGIIACLVFGTFGLLILIGLAFPAPDTSRMSVVDRCAERWSDDTHRELCLEQTVQHDLDRDVSVR